MSPYCRASTNRYVRILILVDSICSCRRRDDKWIVAMNKWQDLTDMDVNKGKTSAPSFMTRHSAEPLNLRLLPSFLNREPRSTITVLQRAVNPRCRRRRSLSRDRRGIGHEQVGLAEPGSICGWLIGSETGLGEWVTIPCTYAGGAKCECIPVDGLLCLLSDLTADVYRLDVAISDLELVDRLSQGKVGLTYGR